MIHNKIFPGNFTESSRRNNLWKMLRRATCSLHTLLGQRHSEITAKAVFYTENGTFHDFKLQVLFLGKIDFPLDHWLCYAYFSSR